MGKVKEQFFSELENNPALHEQYWLNEMFNNHEPVFPESTSLLENLYEEDLSSLQYPTQSFPLHRRKTNYF